MEYLLLVNESLSSGIDLAGMEIGSNTFWRTSQSFKPLQRDNKVRSRIVERAPRTTNFFPMFICLFSPSNTHERIAETLHPDLS